jgi:hypothetical protein
MLTIFFPKHVFQILCQLHLNRDMDNLFMKSQASELGLLNIALKFEIVTYFGAPVTESEDCGTRRDLVTRLGLHSRTVRNKSEEVRINLSSATIIPIMQNRWNRLEWVGISQSKRYAAPHLETGHYHGHHFSSSCFSEEGASKDFAV